MDEAALEQILQRYAALLLELGQDLQRALAAVHEALDAKQRRVFTEWLARLHLYDAANALSRRPPAS